MTDTTEMPEKKVEEQAEKKKRGRKPFLTEEDKKAMRKKYNEKNKEYMKERYKTIYGPNRDRTKIVLCACGEEVRETNAARHRKSKKCIDKCRQNNQLNNEDK